MEMGPVRTLRHPPRSHLSFNSRLLVARWRAPYRRRMSDRIPDPFLAETAFDADEWSEEDDRDEEAPDFERGDVGDELEIEEDRARDR